MRKTRSESLQDTSSQFVNGNEVIQILSEAIKKETKSLEDKITELRNEVVMLRESNIELINLLTNTDQFNLKKKNRESPTKTAEKLGKVNRNTEEQIRNEKRATKIEEKSEKASKHVEEQIINEDEIKGKNNYEKRPTFQETIVQNKTIDNSTSIICNTDQSTAKYKKPTTDKRTYGITGTRNTDNGSLRAAERKIQLYVSRLHPNTTAEDVTDYLKEKFPEVHCEKSQSKFPDSYSSFKVTISEYNYKFIMNPEIWPNGVYINKFFRPRRENQYPK